MGTTDDGDDEAGDRGSERAPVYGTNALTSLTTPMLSPLRDGHHFFIQPTGRLSANVPYLSIGYGPVCTLPASLSSLFSSRLLISRQFRSSYLSHGVRSWQSCCSGAAAATTTTCIYTRKTQPSKRCTYLHVYTTTKHLETGLTAPSAPCRRRHRGLNLVHLHATPLTHRWLRLHPE